MTAVGDRGGVRGTLLLALLRRRRIAIGEALAQYALRDLATGFPVTTLGAASLARLGSVHMARFFAGGWWRITGVAFLQTCFEDAPESRTTLLRRAAGFAAALQRFHRSPLATVLASWLGRWLVAVVLYTTSQHCIVDLVALSLRTAFGFALLTRAIRPCFTGFLARGLRWRWIPAPVSTTGQEFLNVRYAVRVRAAKSQTPLGQLVREFATACGVDRDGALCRKVAAQGAAE